MSGCKFCGHLLEETPGLHLKAQVSRCCQKCFIERFGTAQDKSDYAAEQAERREAKPIPPKTVLPQRIDEARVKIKKIVWE
ncbi:MAG: hypothetical protein V1899_02840 [Planctomycetota bacterium]